MIGGENGLKKSCASIVCGRHIITVHRRRKENNAFDYVFLTKKTSIIKQTITSIELID
jgi:hypothetical protein